MYFFPSYQIRQTGFLFALLTFSYSVQAASTTPVPAQHGMVVTEQHLATKAGVDILKKGGNAVDAAIAVGYTLAVVFPAAGNLGGGGFMTIRMADGRKTFIDFREKAPLAVTPDMYLDKNGNPVPRLSSVGHLAVAVPGTVAGLEMALNKYGTMKRNKLITPAIRLAREGFVLQQGDVGFLEKATADFKKDPPGAAIFLNNDMPFKAGQKLIQKDLANTLAAIRKSGEKGFYKGEVARAIVASSAKNKGIITQTDLDQYAPRELAPVECDYRDMHLISAPPPSSGGVTVCEILHILEGYPLKDWGFRSSKSVQVQIEAMRNAFVDRNSFLGDPSFVKNPVDYLLSKEHAKKIRDSISLTKAGVSSELRPGVAPHEGNNTTHYSIVDKDGNAVSVTYTLNSLFGARVVAEGTGVLLNNEMDDFTVKTGVPNSFGLIQGEKNAIAPGKRPLSSMSPTIVLRDGKLFMVLGTPGGSRIITTLVQTLINVIDYGMNIQEAVNAPRFHQQWLPDVTYLEKFSISPDVRDKLVNMGQRFAATRNYGHVTAIIVGAPSLEGKPVDDNKYYGANDPRGNTGLAAGY